MPTKLDKTVKREIEIDGQPFTVAISPEGVKITQKGFRKGQEVSWKELWNSGNAGGGEASAPSSGTGSVGGGFGGGADSGYR